MSDKDMELIERAEHSSWMDIEPLFDMVESEACLRVLRHIQATKLRIDEDKG